MRKIGWDYFQGTYSRGTGWEECAYLFKNGRVIKHFDNARHIHNVYSYSGMLFVAIGDYFPREPKMEGRSRLEMSADGGVTWNTIDKGLRSNYLALYGSGNYLYAGEDSAQFSPSSRVIRFELGTWKKKTVFTLPKKYMANIGWISECKGWIIIGTFTDQDKKLATLWKTKDMKKFSLIEETKVSAWDGYGPYQMPKLINKQTFIDKIVSK